MPPNLTKEEIFDFIIGDFRDAWAALIKLSRRVAGHRGNFMFARQTMNLLEAAALLCSSDPGSRATPCTGALNDFSQSLYDIDKLYFTELPGPCAENEDFRLPFYGPNPSSELLWALFDLIRHGLAHQYQQAIVELTDPGPPKVHFGIELTGASPNLSLDRAAKRRPRKHLGSKWKAGVFWLHVRTDRLFVDIEKAINQSGILSNSLLTFPHMKRPRRGPKPQSFKTGETGFYRFDSKALERHLSTAGHRKL
jgi:hypothetical protein